MLKSFIIKLIVKIDLLKRLESIKKEIIKNTLSSCGKNLSIDLPLTIKNAQSIHIGNNVGIASFVHIWGGGGLTIEDDVLIASHCAIVTETHDYKIKTINKSYKKLPIHISKNVWIGAHSVIMPGVTIGEGAVIGAGSVVTKDVEPFTIVFGNPAKFFKKKRNLNKMKHPKVYFYCFNEPNCYHDDIIPIAEGLKELGIPYYSNSDYWLQSNDENDFLIKKTPEVRAEDCDIVLFTYSWYNWVIEGKKEPIKFKTPDGLLKKPRRHKVIYMDKENSHKSVSWNSEFREFNSILRTKYNGKAFNPSNLRPWALGLSNRMIECTANDIPFESKKREIVSNFNASHKYKLQLREKVLSDVYPEFSKFTSINFDTDDLNIEPADPYHKLMWKQALGRHSQSYFERLKNAQLSSAFCGSLIPGLPYDPSTYLVGGNKAKLIKSVYSALSLLIGKNERLIQWDSWRFWESLAAGCIPIHVDLAKYGVDLPVMPVNWKHYIGIDLNNIKRDVARIFENPLLLSTISAEGKKWALDNYSPIAVTKRLLKTNGFDV